MVVMILPWHCDLLAMLSSAISRSGFLRFKERGAKLFKGMRLRRGLPCLGGDKVVRKKCSTNVWQLEGCARRHLLEGRVL